MAIVNIEGPAVLFQTPGVLDPRAFTTFGLTSKPNTKTPIGYFGTGLKYVVATLVRMRIPLTVITGGHTYKFDLVPSEFRGKKYDSIVMRRQEGWLWTKTTLPFTTEFGKNWRLWQIFRELEANTRDEEGSTMAIESGPYAVDVSESTSSYIIVEGRAFLEEYHKRDAVFLPTELKPLNDDWLVEVFDKPSDHIYYRGLRVIDLEKPSLFTYNIKAELQLTEDRTVFYSADVDRWIVWSVANSTDREFIRRVIRAEDKFHEHGLDFKNATSKPSEEFVDETTTRRDRSRPYNRSAVSLSNAYVSVGVQEAVREKLPLTAQLQWWIDSGEIAGYPELIKLLQTVKEELANVSNAA